MSPSLFPSLRRIRAFAISPAIAVGVFLLEEPYRGYPDAPIILRLNLEVFAVAYTFVAIPLTVLLGCPAYLLIARSDRPSLGLCAMTGAGIGALPMTALILCAIPFRIDGRDRRRPG